MATTEYHMTAEEEELVVAAIRNAEKNTSGEIRVHIDPSSDSEALERAKEVFLQLKMHETAAQNGVLFYLSVKEHQFAILGDVGIDKVVPDDFWDCTKDVVLAEFKKGDFAKGLQLGIEAAGEKLKAYFPYQSDDINELADEISKG